VRTTGLAAPLAALVVLVGYSAGGCSTAPGRPEVAVGAAADADSALLAAIYVAALRSYGFAARTEAVADPISGLDSGAVTVVPVFTGRTLRRLQPDSSAMSDTQVYRAMVGALPEGVAAGDYTPAADDKPMLLVTASTVTAWGGADLVELPRHCGGTVAGMVSGFAPPPAVGSCRLPPARESPSAAALFSELRSGRLTAAWSSTAAPAVPADLVALADGKPPLIRAENVVPLYRRNALSDRQLLAINEVAGVLDTAALADLRGQVSGGADPQAVAGAWLADHPLGR